VFVLNTDDIEYLSFSPCISNSVTCDRLCDQQGRFLDATKQTKTNQSHLSHHHMKPLLLPNANHSLLLAWWWSISSSRSPPKLVTPLYHIHITLQLLLTPTQTLWRLLIKLSCCRHPPYTAVDQHLEGHTCSPNCQNTCGYQNKPLTWYNDILTQSKQI